MVPTSWEKRSFPPGRPLRRFHAARTRFFSPSSDGSNFAKGFDAIARTLARTTDQRHIRGGHPAGLNRMVVAAAGK
jgi:hypothetical protein